MSIALLVKQLRERTGAGFLDCKKALEASSGDIDKAIEWLQEKGQAKAAKKSGAIAAEGLVSIEKKGNSVVIFEVNSQTDYVANNKQFRDLISKIGNVLIDANFNNVQEANQVMINGKSILELTTEATATIGEKISLRRALKIIKQDDETLGTYVHTNGQIAAVVIAQGATDEIIRNVAMHVASMNPQYLDESAVPSERVSEIREVIAQSPTLVGKPEKIVNNIMQGMLRKALSELTLVDQEFVMEKMTVANYVKTNGASLKAMIRFEVGEGIDKKEEDFAAEVAAQMKNK